jgi:hypothetical protein
MEMHTTSFELPDGIKVSVNHNGDWSGQAEVTWSTVGYESLPDALNHSVIPARLLVQIGSRVAFEQLRSKLVDFIGDLEFEEEPEPVTVGNDMEAGVVLGKDGKPIYWHVPSDRGSAFLPDSRPLWDVYFENKDEMAGFAHSHPGSGSPLPSHTDLTSFAANEVGLGKRYDWWIVTGSAVGLVRWRGPGRLDYEVWVLLSEEPDWVDELRRVSRLNKSGG